MSTTLKGVALILVIGLVLLVVAALADRRTRLRGEGRISPSRADDGASSAATAPPAYVTATELLRRSPARPAVDPATEGVLRDAIVLDLKLASPDLATHDAHRSLAPNARVLVCDDPVTTVRELLPILASIPAHQGVTIAAPDFDASVIDVLAANLAAGTRLVQALVGDASARQELATLTGATPQPRHELQAGGVAPSALGHASMVAASPSQTRVCA